MLSTIKLSFPSVTKVVNATKSVAVTVTKHDVTISKRRKHATCALATACQRQLKCQGMLIGRTTAFLINGNVSYRYKLPPSVGREITSFDRGAAFEPGVYQLSVPSKIHKRKRGRNTNNGRGRSFRHVTKNIRVSLLAE